MLKKRVEIAGLMKVTSTLWTINKRLLAFGLLIAIFCGCGRGYDFPMVPVTGQITFAGGPCPAPGYITFTPIEPEPGLPRRPGSGTYGTDGQFSVTSFRKGDGLIAGRYRVSISCMSGLPDPSKPDPWDAVSYVPKDYQPPELVVKRSSDPIKVDYDVPSKHKK